MSTVTLGGVEVELSSDLGREFTENCVRAGEGLITDRELAEIYELTPADFQTITKDAALIRAIRTTRDHRLKSGLAAREAAARNLVKGQGILDRIMSDEQTNPRFRIAAITETRQTAVPESPNSPSQSDRFVIQINLGSDVEVFNKSIKVDPNDTPPDAQPKLTAPKGPKLVALNDGADDE